MSWFTPEGERLWAGPHWDPQYPQPDRVVGPGMVFTTHAHTLAASTVWVMVDHEPTRVRYTRVTPEVQAGTVTVAVVGSAEHSTTVEVTYDLTALSPSGEDALDRFAQGYDAEIRDWQTAIVQALGAGEPRGA
jgi:hypothetical protein